MMPCCFRCRQQENLGEGTSCASLWLCLLCSVFEIGYMSVNTQQSSCLSFLNARITGMSHLYCAGNQTWVLMTFLNSKVILRGGWEKKRKNINSPESWVSRQLISRLTSCITYCRLDRQWNNVSQLLTNTSGQTYYFKVLGTEDLAQFIKCWSCRNEDLNFIPRTHKFCWNLYWSSGSSCEICG